MRNFVFSIAWVVALLAQTAFANHAHAGLILTLSPDGFGGTNLQLNGSGVVLGTGLSGAFVYESLGADFFINSPEYIVDSTIGPSAPFIGGATMSDFFVTSDFTGTTTGQSIQSFWTPLVGSPLDTSNGLLFNLDDIPFASLIAGTYALTKVNEFYANVGDVQLVIQSQIVPSPATALLCLLGLGCVAAMRHGIPRD